MGVKIKIADHVADVRSFAETVLPGRRPVFVSHRFGNVCAKLTVNKGLPWVMVHSLIHPFGLQRNENTRKKTDAYIMNLTKQPESLASVGGVSLVQCHELCDTRAPERKTFHARGFLIGAAARCSEALDTR